MLKRVFGINKVSVLFPIVNMRMVVSGPYCCPLFWMKGFQDEDESELSSLSAAQTGLK